MKIQGRIVAVAAQLPQVGAQGQEQRRPEPGAEGLALEVLAWIDDDVIHEGVPFEQGCSPVLDQPVHACLGLGLLECVQGFQSKEDVSECGEAQKEIAIPGHAAGMIGRDWEKPRFPFRWMPLSAPDTFKSSPARTLSPRVRILWPGEPGELPEGFADVGYEPGGPAEELGRGGTFRMSWPDGRRAYYRKFRHGGLFGGILGHRYCTRGRLTRELEDSRRLTQLGIRVPVPILGRVERGFLGKRMAIVTESIEGSAFFDVLKDGSVDRELLSKVGQAIAELQETGFRHRDMHPANLLIGTDGEVHILDLEGGSWGGKKGDTHAISSLVRLARYWEKHGPEHALPRIAWILALLRGYEPEPRKRALLFQRCQDRYRATIFWHRLFWRSR